MNETKMYKIGHCSRCNSQNIEVTTDKVICRDCNDWAWFEDAIFSCWNGYVYEEQTDERH
jgi:hypothetical protein